MLRMNMRTSAEAAKFYYTAELSQQEYYSENQEVIGHWGGKGAERLGLRDKVSKEPFAALCDNQHPATGERLTVRTKSNRTVGYDLNFNAPKSVSVLHAFTQDSRILEAFRKAMRETMQEIESDAMTRVRRQGQDTNRRTGNLTWAEFIHFTARPENGVSDPHLHGHCFTFNATFDAEEARWKAGQYREIKRDMPYYQRAFHARLAANIEELGFVTIQKDFAFEIEGVPDSVNEKFSQRTERIEKEAKDRGITNPKIKANLGALTRAPKTHILAKDGLRETLARMSPNEHVALHRVLAAQQKHPARIIDASIEGKAIDYARSRAFERQSVVDEKEFLEVALRLGGAQVDPTKLRARVAADPTLIHRTVDGRTVITTPQVLAEEEKLVAWVRRGHGVLAPLAQGHVIRDERLSAEQRIAVHHVLESRDRVTGVQGKAGTGKTTLMKETIAAIEARGQSVMVLAPTAQASRDLLRREGFVNADTTQQLLINDQMQAKAAGCVWWIDEAGLLSVPDMAKLADLAECLNARLILSGDTLQHRSVRRGDALRILHEHADLKLAKLSQIRRQKGIFREAVEDLSAGRTKEGFAKLDAIGVIQEIPTPDRHKVLAQGYLDALSKGESAIVISPTHAECRKVTDLVRQGLKEAGALKQERTMPVLRSLDFYDEDKRQLSTYRPGWVIEMVQSLPGHRAGQRVVVHAIDGEDLFVRHPNGNVRRFNITEHPDRFQVYEHAMLTVGIGEQIRLTKGGTSLFEHRRFDNGNIRTVTGFTENGDLELDNGMVIADSFAHIAHGYATTSYAAQGKTVKHVFIAESSESFRAASREQFYVAVSRAYEAVHIVTDNKKWLFEVVQNSSQRLAAMDIAKSKKTPPTRPVDHEQEIRQAQQRAEAAMPNRQPVEIQTLLGLMPSTPNNLPNKVREVVHRHERGMHR